MASYGPNTEQQLESIWKLGGLTLWQLTRKVLQGIREDDLFGRASELAFNLLLGLFPLVLFMLVLFGMSASLSSELQSSLLFYFAHFLPPAAFQLLSEVTKELGRNVPSSPGCKSGCVSKRV
jgi:membrane protein